MGTAERALKYIEMTGRAVVLRSGLENSFLTS